MISTVQNRTSALLIIVACLTACGDSDDKRPGSQDASIADGAGNDADVPRDSGADALTNTDAGDIDAMVSAPSATVVESRSLGLQTTRFELHVDSESTVHVLYEKVLELADLVNPAKIDLVHWRLPENGEPTTTTVAETIANGHLVASFDNQAMIALYRKSNEPGEAWWFAERSSNDTWAESELPLDGDSIIFAATTTKSGRPLIAYSTLKMGFSARRPNEIGYLSLSDNVWSTVNPPWQASRPEETEIAIPLFHRDQTGTLHVAEQSDEGLVYAKVDDEESLGGTAEFRSRFGANGFASVIMVSDNVFFVDSAGTVHFSWDVRGSGQGRPRTEHGSRTVDGTWTDGKTVALGAGTALGQQAFVEHQESLYLFAPPQGVGLRKWNQDSTTWLSVALDGVDAIRGSHGKAARDDQYIHLLFTPDEDNLEARYLKLEIDP